MNNNWIIDVTKYIPASDTYTITDVSCDAGTGDYVFLNTTPFSSLTTGTTISASITGRILYVRVNPLYTNPIDNISFKVSNSNNVSKTFSFTYKPSLLNESPVEYDAAPKMNNNNVSYQLLRANPKLTGNVKVVVDSKSNMYIDTFKVSIALSQYKYRHIKVNPSEFYGRSLMAKFHKMPTSDFYKIEDNCYNLFTTVQDYNLQYYDKYNSGVRTNSDKLYSENFALLAPLCIKDVLPDFFLIFKVDKSDYDVNAMSESEKIKYFFSRGKLVKSFDMRLGSDLGTYIRTIQEHSNDVSGDIFVSYDDKNYDKYIGISVDRGVVTTAYESVFDEHKINNQVALNDFYTLGFERNHLVSKDIINFEYMFDDEDESLFSLNTYFGLYVKMNGEENSFSCIGFDYDSSTYTYDSEVHSFTPGTSLKDSSFSELIYGISTPDEFIRLDESFITSPINENYLKVPYKNILTSLSYKESAERYKEFITFSLQKPFDVGENIRIIELDNKTIYEVITTNSEDYLDENAISDVIYNYFIVNGIQYTVKRVSMNVEYRDNILPSDYELVSVEEIKQLYLALKKIMSDTVYPWKYKDNTISICSYSKNTIFERICSVPDLRKSGTTEMFTYSEEDETIKFFGMTYIDKTILQLPLNKTKEEEIKHWNQTESFYLYPVHFDLVGNRIAYICRFLNNSFGDDKNTYFIENSKISDLKYKTMLYQRTDSSFDIYTNIDIKYLTINNDEYSQRKPIIENTIQTKYVESYNLDGYYIINVQYPKIVNSNILLYSGYPLNTGICSVLPIKDFNYNVIDTDNRILYAKTGNIGPASDYSKISVFGKVVFNQSEESIRDYFNKARTDASAGYPVKTYEELNVYLRNLVKMNKIKSDISLVFPYSCKWISTGTDARGERMKIMYDFSNLIDSSSYYVPYTGSDYTEHLGYLKDDSIEYNKYINHDLNSIIKVIGDTSTYADLGTTAKKNIVYGNGRIDEIIYSSGKTEQKFSNVVSSGSNNIEFISGGLKFRISSSNENIVNFSTYKGYFGIFVSVPENNTTHNKPTELVVDEINKQLILTWYNNTNSVKVGGRKDVGYGETVAYKINHTSKLTSSYCISEEEATLLRIPTNGEDFRDINGTISIISDNFEVPSGLYSKIENAMTISTLDASVTVPDPSNNELKDYVDTLYPALWHNNVHGLANDSDIRNYGENYTDAVDAFITLDASSNYTPPVNDIDKLKNDLSNCAVYIKKLDGGKDYSTLTDMFNISVVDSFICTRKNEKYETVTQGYVHSTFAEPEMKNMLIFDYSSQDINDIFQKNFDGSNVIINTVKLVDQMWINKYTTTTNYCFTDETSKYRTSLDVVHDMSIMNDCWSRNMYRKYHINNNEEVYTNVYGYMTGYEKNRFLNSRGLTLHSHEGHNLVIDVWKNTHVSQSEKYIRLNISDSVIYKILFMPGYVNNWKLQNISNNTYRTNYIKNCIMSYININDNLKFEIFRDDRNNGMYFSSFEDSTDISSLTSVKNIKKELKYENNKYYMYIYPEENYTYYAKMTINL